MALLWCLRVTAAFWSAVFLHQVMNHVPVKTFASPVFSSLLDVLLSCTVFLALTVACFLYPLVSMQMPLASTLGLAITAALLELISLLLSIRWVENHQQSGRVWCGAHTVYEKQLSEIWNLKSHMTLNVCIYRLLGYFCVLSC